MNADANEFLTGDAWTWVTAEFAEALAASPNGLLPQLGSRQLGTPITDRRSSWVRRVNIDSNTYFVKTYDYPSLRDRLRGVGRNTCFSASRVRREQAALLWFAEHGFEGPRPVAIAESRSLGLLRRAVLVTSAWPACDLAALWPSLTPQDRDRVTAAVWRFVAGIHRAGFRDRNLDPRNLLIRTDKTSDVVVAKIDSPRHRIVAPNTIGDRLAQEDIARLTRGLSALASTVR